MNTKKDLYIAFKWFNTVYNSDTITMPKNRKILEHYDKGLAVWMDLASEDEKINNGLKPMKEYNFATGKVEESWILSELNKGEVYQVWKPKHIIKALKCQKSIPQLQSKSILKMLKWFLNVTIYYVKNALKKLIYQY